ncbi:MAG TPA: hypothetical protein VFF73_07685 [Planctomycetota bacterium]|nr:hypothetical protein [Planctomycetota bacterium]
MMATADVRARIAAEQTELVRALVGVAPCPQRFDAERVRVSVIQLHEKRKMALKKVWPGLGQGLGDRFAPLFDAYAKEHTHPEWGHGLADGLAFARWLEGRHEVPNEGKLELLDVHLRTVKVGGRLRPRRGLAFSAAILSGPRRIVFGIKLPGLGPLCFALGSPTDAKRWAKRQARQGAVT